MSDKIDFIIGVEIELEYNGKYFRLEPSSYHSRRAKSFGKRFLMESDGSLHAEKFILGRTVEIISKPFAINKYKKFIKSFKRKTYTLIQTNIQRSGKQFKELSYKERAEEREALEKTQPLKEIYNFNKTTGTHIHITPLIKNDKEILDIDYSGRMYHFRGRHIALRKMIDIKTIEEFRNKLWENIKKELPEIYKHFIAQYNRRYAQITERVDYNNRYNEFNLSCMHNYHLEFRSFNLNGVQTWEELYKMFEILTKTIKEVLGKKLKKKECLKDKIIIGCNKEEIEYATKRKTIISKIEIENKGRIDKNV